MGVTQAIGTGIGVVSSLFKGKNESDAANYNAALSDYEADYLAKKAIIDERRLREGEARDIGSARAIAGATGFRTDVGTNADVVADIMNTAAIDAAAIRTAGKIGVSGAKSQAELFREQSGDSLTAGFLDAGSALFTGLSSFRKKRKTSSQLATV